MRPSDNFPKNECGPPVKKFAHACIESMINPVI